MAYAFKGKLIKVTTEKRRLPNGYVVNLEIIKHPGAVLIVPFLNKEKIILIRQFRPVINRYLFELPAGTLARGEKPLDCAQREIIEETGYSARKLTKIGEIFPVPGYSTELITIFKAEKLQKQGPKMEPDEIIRIHPFTKTQIKSLCQNGKVKDAKTICALNFCGWL